MTQVELKITPILAAAQNFQLLTINILRPGNLFISDQPDRVPLPARIEPSELEQLQLPEELDWTQGIVLYGTAPTWFYSHLVNCCQTAPWIACYAMPLGAAVVVKSSAGQPYQIGDTVSLPTRRTPGLAIVIGGPPNSGKSVFSNALRCSLARQDSQSQVYLHRANWDGEGNWSYETPDRGTVQQLIERGKYKIHHLPNADQLLMDYFSYHAQAVRAIRQIADLVIVDVGGMPQPTKLPVVQACTHYIVISSKPDEIQTWHDLFAPHTNPLTVIHSKLATCYSQREETRFLEIEAGPWQEGETYDVPQSVAEVVTNLLADSIEN